MSPALSLLLSLAACALLQGAPSPPRDVRLEVQNFHVQLQWEPAPDSPVGAMYQVEWRRRASRWTRADGCRGNGTGSPRVCELPFRRIHDLYWARVRAAAGGELSEWVCSNELQPYRDTIVGPPTLSWQLQGNILCVNITTPHTPFRRKNGSYKPVSKVLQKLRYWLSLYDGDGLVQQVPCRWSGEEARCTLEHLSPSTRYCMRTVAVDIAAEQRREAQQCVVTPPDPAGFPWVVLTVLSGVFLLMLVAGLCLVQLHVFPSPSETHLPKTLALLNRGLNATISLPALEPSQDPLTLLLPTLLPPTLLPSRGLPAAEPTLPAVPLLLGESLSRGTGGYCANGFGPGCCEGRDPSCARSQLGHPSGSWASSRLEEDEEVCGGDDALEQPLPVGPTRDSHTGDRDYGTPEAWLSLHLQLYSKCQSPAPGAGSCLPLPAPGGTLSQEDVWERCGAAGRWVPLSSVKLPASEQEDGGQLVHALQPMHGHGTEPQAGDSTVQPGDEEQAAPDIPLPSPCPCLLPPNIPRAPAFSGYELRPLASGEL